MLQVYGTSTCTGNTVFVAEPTVTSTANCTVRIVSVRIISPRAQGMGRFRSVLPMPHPEHRRPVVLAPSHPRTPAATWHRFIQRRREA